MSEKTKLVGTPKNVRIKPKPTEYLSKALRNGGHALGNGSWSTANDHVCPEHGKHGNRNKSEPRTVGRPKKPSLPVILGEYIREVDPLLSHAPGGSDLDTALRNVFRDKNNEYLASRGYAATDVTSWAWILTSRNAHEAATRLFSFETDTAKHGAKTPCIPPFITLHLLRQENMDAHTFRLLLIHSLHLMSGQPLPRDGNNLAELGENETKLLPNAFRTTLDSGTCMIFAVRLIRHARRVWPQALLTIARAFAQFFTTTTPRVSETPRSVMKMRHGERVKTAKFNECLWLLSLPARISPYRSASIQQQAQFELLRAMATNKPVLPVTRQGYRAIVAIQLAHKKTVEERQSAELKSPSWPPWKEEKLGIDSLRGNDGMFSRAMHVLSQMKDAGYSRHLWEDISSILAGWDTDHSPTVQTRAMVRRPQPLLDCNTPRPHHPELWVARIRSTRTVREAWACFLSYQDHGLPPKGSVFAAMAEKLIHRGSAIRQNLDHTSAALPGDGREVHPEPSSARDIIYVPTEPPTLDEFLEQMLSQGFRPSGRFLGLLLQSASSLHAGLQYLRCSALTDAQITALSVVQADSSIYNEISLEAFQSVPDLIFASFIKFLSTHSDIVSPNVGKSGVLTVDRFPALVPRGHSRGERIDLMTYAEENPAENHHPRALWHAIQLTKLRKAPYPPAWKHILSALTRQRSKRGHTPRNRALQRILAWHQAIQALGWMHERNVELGEDGFRTLCVAFTKAIDAAFRHPGTAELSSLLIHKADIRHHKAEAETDDFDVFLRHALHVLKDQFDHLVLPASKTPEQAENSVSPITHGSDTELTLPLMLHTPSPATLHAFVRALGSIGDDDGLLNLLQWMSRSVDILKETAAEHSNGDRMMCRTFVAVRVFLERRQEQTVDSRVPSEVLQEAEDLVRRAGWDWPSDVEAEEYCK